MPRFTWDDTGDRLYELGDKHGVLYASYNSSTKRFEGGVPWNGLTAVTESPSGAEANAMYADDIKYGEIRSNEEFGATIEAYTYPDEWAECDGSKALGTSGGMIIGQQKRKTFGFSFVTTIGNDEDGMDHGYKLHIIYNATASPSEKSYSTINDSPEAITFSWEVTTTPIEVGTIGGVEYKPTAQIVIDSTKVLAANLKNLEDILYDSTNAYLPTPSEVYEILFGSAEIPVTGLELDDADVTIAPNGTATVTAIITPENATNPGITCESLDTSVATVENEGLTITITAGATEGTTYVNVVSADNPDANAYCAVTVEQGE